MTSGTAPKRGSSSLEFVDDLRPSARNVHPHRTGLLPGRRRGLDSELEIAEKAPTRHLRVLLYFDSVSDMVIVDA